jgi:hypothetical protein
MGSSRRLGVVLHAKRWSIEKAKALDAVIVQSDVADFNTAKTRR